ncbi:MAG: hypothetical protein J6V57_04840 [Spirochaetaceae bacterium]|nr:hypothetical protein [Spirochaetaceae bacterium]
MALQIIRATGSEVTFCNVEDFNRQKSAMAVILQKYIKYFQDFWNPEYPTLTHLEYCPDACNLSLYSDELEIAGFVLPENLINNLETECRSILVKLLKGELL